MLRFLRSSYDPFKTLSTALKVITKRDRRVGFERLKCLMGPVGVEGLLQSEDQDHRKHKVKIKSPKGDSILVRKRDADL